MPSSTSPPDRLSRAERAARVLDTAERVFYARGVHAVGMDEFVRETGLAKASVYRLFPTKDVLITAYLQRLSQSIIDEIDRVAERERARPARALVAILDAIENDLRREDFRGCPFNNASIEYDDPSHPVRTEARLYRQRLLDRLTASACALAGRSRGKALAGQLATLIDGAYTSAAHLGWGGPARTGMALARQLVAAAGS